MKGQVGIRMRQVVDWEAAVWASAVSGTLIFVLNIFLGWITLGSPWVYVRLTASIILGESALPPPAGFDAGIFLAAVLVQLALSIFYGCLVAIVIFRWGLVVGVLGGAALGLAIYIINFFAISYFFPWFFPMRSWIVLLSHVLFGALAGGIYELLEDEEFLPVEEQ